MAWTVCQDKLIVVRIIYKPKTGVQTLSNPVEITFDRFYLLQNKRALQRWFPRLLTGRNQRFDFERGFIRFSPQAKKIACPSTFSSDFRTLLIYCRVDSSFQLTFPVNNEKRFPKYLWTNYLSRTRFALVCRLSSSPVAHISFQK